MSLRGPPKEGRGNLTAPLRANEYAEIASSSFLKEGLAMTFRVGAGIHSRRRAMDELGMEDPDAEFGRWLEEEEKIPLAKRESTSEDSQA